MDSNTDQPANQPNVTPKPVMDIQPAVAPPPATSTDAPVDQPNIDPASAAVAPTPAEEVEPQEEAEPQQAAPIKHHRAPLAAVTIAVFVAVALGALTVVTYRTSNTTTAKPTTPSSTAPAVVVTPVDVESTSSEIDASLKQVDEAADFNAADLSDAGLDL